MPTIDSDVIEAIPEAQKEDDHWLLWDGDPPEGKHNRQPHWRGDFSISWSDPDDWHTFEEAVEAAQEQESWGIGYVTAWENDDAPKAVLAVIDIDGALDDDDVLRDWVPRLDLFTDAMTYIERSAGGHGLHIPVYGPSLPDWWKDSQLTDDSDDHTGVDVLRNKFCAVTGDRVEFSGSTIAQVDPTTWLIEAYRTLRDEFPPIKDDEEAGDDEYDGEEWLTEEAVRDALSKLNPDMEYQEWLRVGFAVHDWDDGPDGRAVFEDWSSGGSKWDTDAEWTVDDIWTNRERGGGVTTATLVYKAKNAGWVPPTPDRQPVEPEPERDEREGTIVDACASYLEDHCQDHIAKMVDSGSMRIELSWRKLSSADADLADDLIRSPTHVIDAFEEGLGRADFGPQYNASIDEIDVRDVKFAFYEFGDRKKHIRELRRDDVGQYVSLEVQVDSRTQVEPILITGAFVCSRCDEVTMWGQSGDKIKEPHECSVCEKSGPFWRDDRESTFRDHQIIEVSDPPESAVGRSDRLEVDVYDELAGHVEAGDRIVVNGILETKDERDESNPSRRRPIRLTAQSIEQDATGFEDLSPQRLDEIEALSDDPDLYDRLVDSVAPHILTGERGDTIKLALVLQLFGGVERELPTGYKRGNINVMLIGSPGTAKSQYLGAVNKIAPRSVKVSGKNARPAGMTATAVQGTNNEWKLKAGALVKASGGIAVIDEFDKLHDDTMSSMHEALEDQTISVAKADINTTLPARCSVLAAANPKYGEFDRFQPLSEQIEIGPTLISRFDLIFGLEDIVDEDRDRSTAQYQHDTGDVGKDDPEPEIELELLTQYIAYARQNVFPSYESDDVRDALVDFYVDRRQEAVRSDEKNIRPIGPRVNELLRRLSQASARARHSDVITMDDAERVMGLFRSTIGEVGLTDEGILDGGKLDGGYGSAQRDIENAIFDAIEARRAEFDRGVPRDEIIDTAAGMTGADRSKIAHRFDKLKSRGEVYEPSTGAWLKT